MNTRSMITYNLLKLTGHLNGWNETHEAAPIS